MIENDSKTRKLSAFWTETEKRWKVIFHLRTADSKTTEKRFFCIGLWLKMRSEYFTTTPRRKNTTLSPVNRCHRPQHQYHETFIIRRSCFVSDGTKRVLFTMSCWNLAIPLRVIGIGYNWFVWAMYCEKKGRNTSKDMIKLFFFMTTLGFAKVVKKYLETFKWDVLPHPLYSSDIAPSDYWLFRRMQITGSHRYYWRNKIINFFNRG